MYIDGGTLEVNGDYRIQSYEKISVRRGIRGAHRVLAAHRPQCTYKPNEWNVYTDIKEKLVRLGIPADEIQFIQCATTDRHFYFRKGKLPWQRAAEGNTGYSIPLRRFPAEFPLDVYKRQVDIRYFRALFSIV